MFVTLPGTPGDRIDDDSGYKQEPQRFVVWIVLGLLTPLWQYTKLKVLSKFTRIWWLDVPEGLDGHVRSLNPNQPAGADDDNNPFGVLMTNTKRANTLDTTLNLPSLSRPVGAGEPWTRCWPFEAFADQQVLEGLGHVANPPEPCCSLASPAPCPRRCSSISPTTEGGL